MRIVIAPDSFKESLSAADVARAIAAGLRDVLPSADVVCVPMADGGEGSLDAILSATSAQVRYARVQDANGHPREARWAWLGDGRAFIEMASAAGLEHIDPSRRNPLRATSHGVGELVRHALDAGAVHIVLGLGGSATNDGGAGLLQALGARLLDAEGAPIEPGGGALARLHDIDADGVDSRLEGVVFELAVDVDNPLCGPTGASAIFGPQKGATAQDVHALDAALSHFADVCAAKTGQDHRDLPGMGAAGGLGFAIRSFFDARFRPGVDLVAELAGLPQALHGAQLVFTGEGRLDSQSLLGKTPVGVARHAKGIPVIVLAGSLGANYQAVYDAGITAAFSLAAGPATLEEAYRQAPGWLRERAADCLRLWLAANGPRTPQSGATH